MTRLTLRGIPAPVVMRLRVRAQRRGQSTSETALALLSQALTMGQPQRPKRKRDLSRFAGTMTDAQAREFEANTRAFGVVDSEQWRAKPVRCRPWRHLNSVSLMVWDDSPACM